MGTFTKIGALITFLGVTILAGSFLLTGLLEADQKTNEVVLEVDYFEHWNMTFSHDDIEASWSGMGRKEKLLVRPTGDVWVISVKAEKIDASLGKLGVRIKLLDGSILGEASTVQPYGKISLVVEIP